MTAVAEKPDISRALKIHGYMQEAELEQLGKWAQTHPVIIEIGSYLGRSTRALADNTEGTVWAVDDWYGPRDVKLYEPDRKSIFGWFCDNMADHIRSFKVVPMRANTHIGYPMFWFTPDMIFIDGSHEYEDVVRDINWARTVMPNGLLCGHDSTHSAVFNALCDTLRRFERVPETTLWYTGE